jgi:hypothetical protein
MTLMPYEDYARMRNNQYPLDRLGRAFLVVPARVSSRRNGSIWLTRQSALRAVYRARAGGREMEIIEVDLTAIRPQRKRSSRI